MIPLAERMRPLTPDDYVGQPHLMSPDAPLRKSLEQKKIHSCIFWGPPGVGKTSLALLMSAYLDRKLYALSAVNAGVKDVREILARASKRDLFQKDTPILFIDEIHRFNKSQQDALLEAVEKGIIILIGATTENPSFEVNNALLSRCQVYILTELSVDELKSLISNALSKDIVLNKLNIRVDEPDALMYFSGGDARKLYNLLELIVNTAESTDEIIISNASVEQLMLTKSVMFDKGGEMHYDIISAFIKSIKGSDPDAAVYWMARMIAGGEDPIFICRRMVVLAAEDIGLANSNGLLIANACMDAVHKIGMPEARIIMAQCAIYLACAEKSNSAYVAINQALEEVNRSGDLSVPLHLRNAPTKLMKNIGYGADYKYPHNFPGNYANQQYMPDKLVDTTLYTPGHNLAEAKMKAALHEKKNNKETK